MATFGETLRAFRHSSNDPHRLNRRLSQERLGRLIGEEMGDMGFTGAAIAYWESGESKINADDRKVLCALIKVMHECGGVKTLIDANHFLEAGNYRILDDGEARKIFPEVRSEGIGQPSPENMSKFSIPFLIENFFAIPKDELKTLIAKANEEGPDPSWPRVLAALMRRATVRFSITRTTILWIWVGLIAWWLIAPSLRLPFADQGEMYRAMEKY
ncbi:MAG TPA: hypothetical protein VMJ90_07080, partial [Anaerolineales bacterium]|nr:hypothetical protein [Anaerolineales bacterium]